MTPGPRSPRRPGSIASRLSVFSLSVALPRGLDATTASASAGTAASAGIAPGHQSLALAAAPAEVALVLVVAAALVLGAAALVLVRRRRRFEAGAARVASNASPIAGWPPEVATHATSGSRDPLVSLMTRPDATRGNAQIAARRSRRPDEEAAWVRRLERPGRRDEDRT